MFRSPTELSSSQHVRPGIVAFYSHINSTPGLSETPIINMVRVAAEMDPALRKKFETTAVINHFIMPPQSQYIRVWGQKQVRGAVALRVLPIVRACHRGGQLNELPSAAPFPRSTRDTAAPLGSGH